jgi:hypothetical protein
VRVAPDGLYMFGAGVYLMCFIPNPPSLDSLPIEYFGIYLAENDLVGVYYPGPGLLKYDPALIGLRADIDLF